MMKRLVITALIALAPFVGPAAAEEEAQLIGDAERGEDLFRQCIGCHQIGPGAKNHFFYFLNLRFH